MPDFASLDYLPLLYAVLLGGAIGLERQWSGRPAGLRTHVIVCLSATMLIVMSRHFVPDAAQQLEGERIVFDPNRMSAGIVTGIGFLGAATVLRSGDLLRGLTTAACIWYVAGLGIVLGNEEYALAIASTAIVLVVLTLLHMVTQVIRPVIYRRLVVTTTRTELEELMKTIQTVLREERLQVLDVSSGFDRGRDLGELVFYVSMKNRNQMPRLTEKVVGIDGVDAARWKLINVPH